MTVIQVENLGKKYTIGHQKGTRYQTLRDTLAHTGRGIVQRLRHPLSPNREIVDLEEIWALRDVNFEIKQGERVGIIGRNGAGKSTLLKILSRITHPTTGRVTLNGRVASLLEVGTGFHPELSGRENIYLNGAILGMTRQEIKRKFDEIVAFAEVEKFLDTPVKHYSSGMYVRLAFAVAAHLEPEILLVDEVLAVGDAQFQKKCLGKMDEVAQEGRTVFFVSHNMGAIGSLCNKVILLENGQISDNGETTVVITRYLAESIQNKSERLERLRYSGYGKQIRFSQIMLLSEDGNNVQFGEPIRYKLTLHADITFENLSIGSSIFDLSGICIGTLFTKETFSISEQQPLILELCIMNITLAPGTYYAGFSIGWGGADGRHDLDMIIGTPLFQILSFSSKNMIVSRWQTNWGSIVFCHATLSILERGIPK
ncbi:ABC transporter, ATP-binding protein [Candidatus Moduliflexus flocculans]|uniref:ABC transporter, ATP-binding protein n=1 Tax=Candidatus Moduliflexus flocculans TaxID=1499966 RepID=A0A081BMT9_9BACT|nr:ABC transporter, ATP-binding protein [Candidatus Moduliflexus flocculans]